MGVHRHGISLQVFNSSRIGHENRNSISSSNHVLLYSLYKYNSPLLTRKLISLMNENK